MIKKTRAHADTHTHLCMNMYIYTHIYTYITRHSGYLSWMRNARGRTTFLASIVEKPHSASNITQRPWRPCAWAWACN